MPETQPLLAAATDPNRFAPGDALARALRGWGLLAAALVVGALVGMAILFFQPTQYETGFSVLTSIDLTSTGELTQFDEDFAMDSVGMLLANPNLYARIAAQAAKEGLTVTPLELKAAVSVERRLGTWRVRLRGSDPPQVEALARIWLQLAGSDLGAAYPHALAADGLLRRQLSLEACLARSVSGLPSAGQCGPADLKTLQAQLVESAGLIAKERAAARGLSSAVVFETLSQDILPARAAQYRRGQMAAGGGLIGFVIGIWALQSDLAAGLARRRRG